MKNRDFIQITRLQMFAHHGVYDFETSEGQEFQVNAKIYLDMKKAAKEDALEESVHYGEACCFIERFLTEHTYQMLEAAVYHTMKALFLEYPLIREIEFELCKPNAPITVPFENISVCMHMSWHTVYIGLGSNMGDKQAYLDEAVKKLKNDSDFRNIRCSKFIQTKPYGGVEQEDFLNGVLEVETILEADELLDRLQQLEQEAKRERTVHWGPRTLDLDILFFDDEIIDSEKLIVPHPDMANREFVLQPMMELAPYFRHPLTKKTIADMWKEKP